MKERYAVTELRKQANRMTFGELEEDLYQNDLGYTRGNIGKGGIGGAVRAAQVDERTKVRISQTLKKNMQKQQAVWGGATSIKGSDANGHAETSRLLRFLLQCRHEFAARIHGKFGNSKAAVDSLILHGKGSWDVVTADDLVRHTQGHHHGHQSHDRAVSR